MLYDEILFGRGRLEKHVEMDFTNLEATAGEQRYDPLPPAHERGVWRCS